MVLLLVTLIKDVAHSLLFLHMVIILHHAHIIKLNLSEKRLVLSRLPRVFGL